MLINNHQFSSCHDALIHNQIDWTFGPAIQLHDGLGLKRQNFLERNLLVAKRNADGELNGQQCLKSF